MPSVEAVMAFAVASVIMVVIPGPSVLFVIGRSLAHGRTGGLLSVVGNTLGTIPLVIAVTFGLGAIIAHSVVAFTVIKMLGAGYLVYLGVQAIRHRNAHAAPARAADHGTLPRRGALVRQGFVVGITNPKTIVFLVAVLPQFVTASRGAVATQMLVLGLMCVGIGFLSDVAWAALAGTARNWFARSPRRLSRMTATGGALMVGLGAVLAVTDQKR